MKKNRNYLKEQRIWKRKKKNNLKYQNSGSTAKSHHLCFENGKGKSPHYTSRTTANRLSNAGLPLDMIRGTREHENYE
jgi:hypothetical protein